MINAINSLKNSYKRKIIIFAAAVIVAAFIGETYKNKSWYTVYFENQPVAVTSVKPQKVYEAYGNAKAKLYAEGKSITGDSVYIEETKKRDNGIEYMGEVEIAEAIYTRLDDKEPILTGKTTQVFEYINPYYADCEYVYDDTMYEDEVMVTQEAEPGIKEVMVVETYYNGERHDRKMLEANITKEAVPRVVHIGTIKRPEYILPVVDYILTSNFGPRWGTNHNGIDLAVPTGTSVMAAKDGLVIQAGWNGGYGISVYIDHGNGVITRYGHMSESLVSVGQAVKQGDVIGLSGSTGDSTGPHVHFEMREGDVAVDPSKYVSY
ncbi:MAG: peptidoglycan DD-metalloendopeptidase family protein [Lachnospiraceae bacterium]|nr:peptidoglycan DD-metalloendopeptidase family protein [Lachnospiraceae bacterium]